jgi:DNA-binding transcriptional regulator YhcF (GntR family)
MTKELDQKLIDNFASNRALAKKLDEWIESTRETMIELMKEGYVCPDRGPYLLVIEQATRLSVDWKAAAFDTAVEMFLYNGKKPEEARKAAAKLIANVEKHGKKQKQDRLVVKPNPFFPVLTDEARKAIPWDGVERRLGEKLRESKRGK